MSVHYRTIGLAALSLTALGLVSLPGRASAQDTKDTGALVSGGATDPANQMIDIDLESSNLYYGLKLLFSQVKVNFTIDESLKSLTVTAHLSHVPYRIALETLLKSTSTPLTYRVENGIYSILPKVETGGEIVVQDPLTSETDAIKTGYRYGYIRTNGLSALDIVLAFKGNVINIGEGYGNGRLGGNTGGSLLGGSGNGNIGGYGNQGGSGMQGGNGNSGGLGNRGRGAFSPGGPF